MNTRVLQRLIALTIITVLGSAVSGFGQANPPLLIEQAQRAYQARYQLLWRAGRLPGDWPGSVSWPAARCCDGQEVPAPDYPPNSFYSVYQDDPEKMAELVADLADKLAKDEVLRAFVSEIAGRSNVLVHSTNAFTQGKIVGAGDMPPITDVDAVNYPTRFNSLDSRIQQLSQIWVQGNRTEVEYLSGSYAFDEQPYPDCFCWDGDADCCAQAKDNAVDAMEAAASDTIGIAESVGVTVYVPTPPRPHDWEASLAGGRGRVSASVASYDATSATMYVMGSMSGDDPPQDPPSFTQYLCV